VEFNYFIKFIIGNGLHMIAAYIVPHNGYCDGDYYRSQNQDFFDRLLHTVMIGNHINNIF
jgi:hypothetical protein